MIMMISLHSRNSMPSRHHSILPPYSRCFVSSTTRGKSTILMAMCECCLDSPSSRFCSLLHCRSLESVAYKTICLDCKESWPQAFSPPQTRAFRSRESFDYYILLQRHARRTIQRPLIDVLHCVASLISRHTDRTLSSLPQHSQHVSHPNLHLQLRPQHGS